MDLHEFHYQSTMKKKSLMHQVQHILGAFVGLDRVSTTEILERASVFVYALETIEASDTVERHKRKRRKEK